MRMANLGEGRLQEAGYRLLVRSIGGAGPALIPGLRSLRPATDAQLAALLYRAPSELGRGLSLQGGTELCELLRTTGLDVDLVPDGEPFTSGDGDHEVALVIGDVSRLASVVREIAAVAGVNLETAKRI